MLFKDQRICDLFMKRLRKRSPHYIVQPFIFRSFIDRFLGRLFDCVGWQGVLHRSSATAERVLIVGCYEDVPQAYALLDYLRDKSTGEARDDIKRQVEFDVLKLKSRSGDVETSTDDDNDIGLKLNYHDLESFFDDEQQSHRGEKMCSDEWSERLKNTHLVIFGNIFCYHARRNQQFPGMFLDLLFQLIPENSLFVFSNVPSAAESNVDIHTIATTTQHKRSITISPVIEVQAPKTKYKLEYFVAWKSVEYRLSGSFYSTISYIRSNVMSANGDNVKTLTELLNSTSNNDTLNIESLMKSPRFSSEAVEMDLAKCHTFLGVQASMRQVGFDMGAEFHDIETAMKRIILLDWFEQVRQQLHSEHGANVEPADG